MKLEKATLKALDSGEPDIKFMFNPNEISFKRSMSLEHSPGAQTETGQNKVSFKHPNPYTLTIGEIFFDTYETGENVLNYILKFKNAVEFTQKGEGNKKRPPIYLFIWGKNRYLRCFVSEFGFKLSLFLPDGTPVRAIVNLTLEQVDMPTPERSQSSQNPSASQRLSAPSIFT